MGVGAETGNDLAKVTSGMTKQTGLRGAVQVKMNNGARFVSRLVHKGIFYHGWGVDGKWMGFETTGLGVLSGSHPCDP
jgi:hypothetical protein